jgi:hypothetical protein
MATYRRRQAEGKVCVIIELDERDVEILIEARTLDPGQDFHTRGSLAQAVKVFLRAARYA